MKLQPFLKLCVTIIPICYCFCIPQATAQPDLGELMDSSASGGTDRPSATAAIRFNDLNTLVRDGRIGREEARIRLRRLVVELREEYYRRGGEDYGRESWLFPLAGYDARAAGNGRNRGYVASGYDYFSGNRHGGHPALDLFIRDRDQDSLDDRTGKPVSVLSMTGGMVVALERKWEEGSGLRGGKYLWVYDPANGLLVYYAHNSELFVELGQIVRPGERLALVGRSGYNASKRRSPTHLHLSVLRIGEKGPVPVNVWPELSRAGTAAERPGIR